MRTILVAPLLQFAGGLRFRNLFLVTGTLFLLSLLFPDPIPFMDEVLLGLATLLLSQWKKRKEPVAAAEPGARDPAKPVIDLPPDQVRRGG